MKLQRARGVRRVEYDPGWGWIARNRDGNEIAKNFRWASRSVARTVAYEADCCASLSTPTDGEKR